LHYVNRNYLRREGNHYERYGTKDSWAVITGGSDGIGLEISLQMAAQGFNVCIVGRNADKIAQVLKDISVKYPKIKTRAVICDFAKLFTV
jgi:17beta-estradiol 17-dehydrogenase / very-long-chain 3-oxoacyl-CoA reductase